MPTTNAQFHPRGRLPKTTRAGKGQASEGSGGGRVPTKNAQFHPRGRLPKTTRAGKGQAAQCRGER